MHEAADEAERRHMDAREASRRARERGEGNDDDEVEMRG
jgi:hypothetical protein